MDVKTGALHFIKPVARIALGCGTSKKWTFLNLTPLPLLQKPHFWPILWLKVDLLALRFGGASHPLHSPGYCPGFHASGVKSSGYSRFDEMQPCIMKSKIVSTAVVGLEPWVSGKLNVLWGGEQGRYRSATGA